MRLPTRSWKRTRNSTTIIVLDDGQVYYVSMLILLAMAWLDTMATAFVVQRPLLELLPFSIIQHKHSHHIWKLLESNLIDGRDTEDTDASTNEHQPSTPFDSTSTQQVNGIVSSHAMDGAIDMNHQARFGGINRLYSVHAKATTMTTTASSMKKTNLSSSLTDKEEEDDDKGVALKRLEQATVVVVGLGGVGSWAAEALCRSGIGHLVLIDLDDICISNTNRQIHTLSSTIGQFKIDALAERFRDLNPRCQVTCIHEFISKDNVHEILQQIQSQIISSSLQNHHLHNIKNNNKSNNNTKKITAVLDAMDGATEKSALMAACADAKLPVVTVGGAAGLLDPTRVVCDDLTRVFNDKLLGSCRTNLRKYHGFAPGKAFFHEIQRQQNDNDDSNSNSSGIKRWKIPAVYSTETVPTAAAKEMKMESSSSFFRLCDGALGTACFVTGTFGFVAASTIVTAIAQNNLKPPRRGFHPNSRLKTNTSFLKESKAATHLEH